MPSFDTHVEVAHIRKDIPVAWYVATIQKVVDDKYFLVEYGGVKEGNIMKRVVPSQYIRPCPPKLQVKSFDLLDEVEAFYKNGWWPGLIAKVYDDSMYNVKFRNCEEEIEFSHNDLRLLHDWIDGQWIQASPDKAVNLQNLGIATSTSCVKLVHASSAAHKCNETDSVIHSSGCKDDTECAFPTSATNSESETSEGLTCEGELAFPQPCTKNGESVEDGSKLSGVRENTPNAIKTDFDVHTPSINKEPIFHIKALVEKWRSEFIKEDASNIDCITQASPNTSLGETRKDPPSPLKSTQQAIVLQNSKQRFEHRSQGNEVARENIAGKKRRRNDRPQKTTNIESSLDGDSRKTRRDNNADEEGSRTEGISGASCSTCSHNSLEAEDQFSEGEAQSEDGENGVILPNIDKRVSKRARTEKPTNASEPPLAVPPKEFVLPFEKCSPVWHSIESLEIFSRMPQQPHFRPLETYNKEFREGMAIGLMVTFSNLVKHISKLRIDDTSHKFEEILRTLAHLEDHGFSVPSIRARISELLRMKDKREQLVDKRTKLEGLFLKKKSKKDELHVKIESVEKATTILELSLSHLDKEKSYILEQTRKIESNCDKLAVDSRKVEDELLSAENDFEAFLSAAW